MADEHVCKWIPNWYDVGEKLLPYIIVCEDCGREMTAREILHVLNERDRLVQENAQLRGDVERIAQELSVWAQRAGAEAATMVMNYEKELTRLREALDAKVHSDG